MKIKTKYSPTYVLINKTNGFKQAINGFLLGKTKYIN